MKKETIKYLIVIICCLLIMISTFIIKIYLYEKVIKKDNEDSFYITDNIISEKIFSNRYVYISKEGQQILVGNNKSEIENGFFDIKIIKEDKYCIYINKLFKEKIDITNIIDDLYLNELVNTINNLFNMDLKEEDIRALKNIIKENYISIRKVNNVDNVLSGRIMIVNKYCIKVDFIDNILKLQIDGV